MAIDIAPGTVIAENFTVKELKKKRPIPPDMREYVSDMMIVEVDAKYENDSRLTIFTLKGSVPPAGQWPFHVPAGWSDVRVERAWELTRFDNLCGAMAYKALTLENVPVAVIRMMTTSETAFIEAMTTWRGFRILGRSFVNFKPGMEMRTEMLLEAGIKISQK